MDKGVVSRNIRVALGSNIYRIPILNWDHSMHSFSFHKIKLIIMLSYHDLDSTNKTEIMSMQTCHMHIQTMTSFHIISYIFVHKNEIKINDNN
jgi:hypothetical protein